MGSVLRGAAARWGERVAFHHADRELTYRQVLAEAAQTAHGLRRPASTR